MNSGHLSFSSHGNQAVGVDLASLQVKGPFPRSVATLNC